MNDAEKRVLELEKSNKQLQRAVDQLTRRLQQVEQQSKRAYHSTGINARSIVRLQRSLEGVLSKLRINQ